MKILSTALLGLLVFTQTQLVSAEEQVKQSVTIRFQEALTAYDNSVTALSDKDMVPIARTLYEVGSEYYQKNDINLGVLAFHYATALNQYKPSEKSIPFLEQAISIYKGAEEVPIEPLIDALVELGKTYYHDWDKKIKGNKYLQEALILAKNSGDKIQLARTKLDLGKIYLSHGRLTKKIVKKAKRLIESSYLVFKEANVSKQLEAAFWSGKANILLKRKETAAEYFELTIKDASNNKVEQHYSMISHAFLVDVYSKLGEDDKATEHCQAIGKNQLWEDNVEPKPLYIVQPKYPRSAAMRGKEGFVTLDFTIDSNGFTKNISVAKTAGHKGFPEETMKVIEKWRFAPKYENGQPVDASVRYTMEFKLAK